MGSTSNSRFRVGWLFCLPAILLLAISTPSDAAPPPVPEGVVHFHTSRTAPHLFQSLYNPETIGGEMILWWQDVEAQQGRYDWSVVKTALDRYALAQKTLDIRISTAHNGPNFSPSWLFEKVGVRRIGRGFWEDFEQPRIVYSPTALARVTSGSLLSGPMGNILLAKGGDSEKGVFLSLTERALAANCDYSAQWDAEALKDSRFGVRLMQGKRVVEQREFQKESGWAGSLGFSFRTATEEPCRLEWFLEGGAKLKMDHFNVIKIVEKPEKKVSDFEEDLGDWLPGEKMRWLKDTPKAPEGKGCLEAENTREESVVFLKNNPESFKPQLHQGYQFSILCHGLTDAKIQGMLVHPDIPGNPMGERTVTVKKGDTVRLACHSGVYTWKPGFQAQWRLVGPGRILVDNADYKIWSDRVLCYPDYFDPAFFQKWSALVEDFANNFRDHPALGCISVGGFGRWEEVILEEETPGLLDAQWLARGYSREKYLAHITRCMDLYRRLFPGHPLRVCLAYGLKQGQKTGWMYRRVAQAAVKRNIGLKQNGLSEKYDSWDVNTDASYLYHRYRNIPHISLTHETGGHIFANSIGAMGHPLSLINRGLMNYMHVLFLYRPDIHSRHVSKYFTYFNALAGRPLFTRFYCHLGLEKLTHSAAPFPMEYHNQWLGLRQVDHEIANVEYLEMGGEKCARTTPGDDRIFFDVDDRAQYDGMFGVVIRVEFLDDGPGQFALGCTNNWTNEWDVIGFVEKENSGQWKVVDFMKSDWCASPRNSGADVQVDLAIHDVGPGETTVRNVELRFVPASGWQMTPLHEDEPGPGHSEPGQTLRRSLPETDGPPPYRATLPLWAEDPHGAFCSARLLADMSGHKEAISRKNFSLPAHGDQLFLPFVPRHGADGYSVEFAESQGQTGWQKTAEGKGALSLYAYANQALPLSLEDKIFLAAQPFNGLQWQGEKPESLRLQRWLEGRGWSDSITSAILQSSDEKKRFFFEPQAPGRFRISGKGLEDGQDWQLLALLPAQPKMPQTAFPTAGIPELAWNFRHEAAVREWALPEKARSLSKGLEIVCANEVAQLDSPIFDWQARKSDLIQIEVRNPSGSGLARVYWRGEGETFSGNRSFWLALAPYDTHPRLYRYPIGLEPGWTKSIAQLRILPGGNTPMTGRLTFQTVALERQKKVLALDFDSSLDDLVPLYDSALCQSRDGLFVVRFPAGKGDVLEISPALFNFEAQGDQVLEMEIRASADLPKDFEFRWWVLGHPEIAADEALEKSTALSLPLSLPVTKQGFAKVQLPLGKSPEWQGHISRMAIAVPATAEGGLVEIRSLQIRSAP